MDRETTLRTQLAEALEGGHAHMTAGGILSAVPASARGKRPGPGLVSPWQLLEHLRISQWDILEFSRNPRHVSPEWPEGYWPESEAPPEPKAWDQSVASFGQDLKDLLSLVRDPAQDLLAPFAHGQGQTLAREAVLAAVHNAYHLGQLVSARKLLGIWPPK